MNVKFSVLMSIYAKDNPQHFKQAVWSVTRDQSVPPDELVLVVDGPVTPELETEICAVGELLQSSLQVVRLSTNVGLGMAMRVGLEHCSYEYVARMDADDISVPTRFQRQLETLERDGGIDLLGTGITEFSDDPSSPEFVKSMPSTPIEIRRMARHRNPVVHPTVIFRSSAVREVGSYRDVPLLEDYDLFVRMIAAGKRLENLPESLLCARIGSERMARRGDLRQLRGWHAIQCHLVRGRIASPLDYVINMTGMVGFLLISPRLRKVVYACLLRKRPIEAGPTAPVKSV